MLLESSLHPTGASCFSFEKNSTAPESLVDPSPVPGTLISTRNKAICKGGFA
jgi:hypothetical protein